MVIGRLKIRQRDSVIKSGHSRSSLEYILSKPVALDLLIACTEVQRLLRNLFLSVGK